MKNTNNTKKDVKLHDVVEKLLKDKKIELFGKDLKYDGKKLFQLVNKENNFTMFIATNRKDTIKEGQYDIIKDVKYDSKKTTITPHLNNKNNFVTISSNDVEYLNKCIDKVMIAKGYKKAK